MLYAIISEDVEDSLDIRKTVRPEHLSRLQALKDEGKLVIAGPHPAIDNDDPGPSGYTGSLVIAEFDCLNDAEIWAKSDPFVKAGVYKNVTIKPFKKVLP